MSAGPCRWTWASFAVAGLATAGSLWLSLGMGLRACPLCFYQRTFVMGVAAILGVGLLARVRPIGGLALVSLPLATAGLGVAAFHVQLEINGRLECPDGILGIGSSPKQALVAQAALFLLVLTDAAQRRSATALRRGSVVLAIVAGLAMGWACIRSSPPLPAAPAAPYEEPPLVCRPPFAEGDAAPRRESGD